MNAILFITGLIALYLAYPVAARLPRKYGFPAFLILALGGTLMFTYALAQATA